MEKLADLDFGTHCYVGALPCGCGVAIARDVPAYKKHTAKDVAEMIGNGLVVQRLPHADACAAFDKRCAEYPHTDWQHRNEAARRARKLPLSVGAVDPVDGVTTK
jgi:hypothetical protein